MEENKNVIPLDNPFEVEELFIEDKKYVLVVYDNATDHILEFVFDEYSRLIEFYEKYPLETEQGLDYSIFTYENVAYFNPSIKFIAFLINTGISPNNAHFIMDEFHRLRKELFDQSREEGKNK
ncbi:MAG: hypothetical protein HYW78_03295 [Parcubacteria group bacterium]|nr:hypothetical protein [Parcubacteria group bacterium]